MLEKYPFLNSALKNCVQEWLELPVHNSLKQEIYNLLDSQNSNELTKRFTHSLQFGTAGVRALMGAGYSHLNEYTIAKITLGLIEFIKTHQLGTTVVISYDTRLRGQEFVNIVAQTVLLLGLTPILFPTPSPSPILAFATQYYKAAVGIMITASHNPKDYNGYKIYNQQGGQFISKDTEEIFQYIQAVDNIPLSNILSISLNNIDTPDNVFYDSFYETIKKTLPSIHIDEYSIPVVYSPFYGSGVYYGEKIIQYLGGKLILVEEENIHNGEFPGANAPNPEESENFKLAIQYAQKHLAPICILTDPDADRLGLYEDGHFFNGNEIGIILSYFLLSHKPINSQSIIVSSVVSSGILPYLAKYFHVSYKQTLTGFKYIGNIIQQQPQDFIFGFEESYGCLAGNYIQDKDAIGSLALIYQLAQFLYSQKQTFSSYLANIYKEIAFSKTKTIELLLNQTKMGQIMQMFRNNVDNIMDIPVIGIINYLTQTYIKQKILTKSNHFEGLEKTDLIKFELKDYLWLSIRPSGTESKIKIYIELLIPHNQYNSTQINQYIKQFEQFSQNIQQIDHF